MNLKISFIVSAFDRPAALRCCIASLLCQSRKDFEIIVTDNSAIGETPSQYKSMQGVDQYWSMNKISCYHSAEFGVSKASGEYLCFPSDDSYYVPLFVEKMVEAADSNNWDLVYCDMLMDTHNGDKKIYKPMIVKPEFGHIDKTGFILRRSCFIPFPSKPTDPTASVGCDGYLIEALIASGISHGKVPEILAVHN